MTRKNTTLDDIGAIIGAEAALLLVREWGGRTMYVPKKPTPRLIAAIGAEPAARLCAEWADQQVAVPTLAAYHLDLMEAGVARMRAAGMHTADIAEVLDVSPRRVQQLTKALTAAGLIEARKAAARDAGGDADAGAANSALRNFP